MIVWKRKEKVNKLEPVIDQLLESIIEFGPDSPEYPKLVMQLRKLYSLREEQPTPRIDPNTVLMVIGNLFGILVIVAYEQKHVMTSKGLGFILKSK